MRGVLALLLAGGLTALTVAYAVGTTLWLSL